MASHDDLLQQGIAAARAGQQDMARQLLAQAIKANPSSEAAWIWMSSVVATNEQRVHCLQQVLAINPANELAQRGLRALGALGAQGSPPPPQLAEPAPAQPTAEPSYSAPPPQRPQPPAPDGVPLIDTPQIEAAQRDAEVYLRQLRDRTPAAPQIHWAEPGAHARAAASAPPGSSISMPSLSNRQVTAIVPIAVVAGIALLVVIVVVIFTSMLVNVIGGGSGGQVGAARPTAAATPTKRPPRTPTPEGTSYDPGPTVAPGNAPHGDPRFGRPSATPPYVATGHPGSSSMTSAVRLYYQGDYAGALDAITKARENGDDSVDGYFIEGMSLAHQFDYEEAVSAFNDGLGKDDQFAPNHAGLAYAFLQTNKLAQANGEAQQAITLDPNLVMAYVTLSQVQVAQGDFQAALKTISDARTKNSKYNVDLIVAEGNIYLAQGDFSNATADGNLAYYIDPVSEGSVLLLARGQTGLKLYSSATIILENYIDNINPGSAASWALLAKLYNQQGRLTDALEANNRAVQLSPNQSDALAARGLLYLEQGKLDLGCADLNNALESDSQNYDARLGRAQCAYSLGDYDHVLTDVEFLRGVTPDNPVVQTLYVQVLAKKGRYNESISAATVAFARGLLNDQQRADVLEAQGYALYKLGNYSEAASDIEAALAISQTGTRHFYKGLILEGLRDYPRAAREYEWVLFWNRTYNYPFAAEAEAHLKTVDGYLGAPTSTPTPTVTPSLTPSPTPTKGGSPTPTPGKTTTPTPTPSPGKTSTPGPTKTPTPGG